MSDAAQKIVAGEPLRFSQEFDHPDYGKLTFTGKLPKNRDWLQHSAAQERLAPGNPSEFSAAIAAVGTILDTPVISETRVEDPDTPGHVTLQQTFYDPLEDDDPTFILTVWGAFFAWRVQLLSDRTKDAVKNSSGATSGLETDASSPAPTTSPTPTLA